MPTLNQKHALPARWVALTDTVQITFNDSSSMKVKTAGSQAPTIPEGVRVREASEDGTAFVIGCEDDTTIGFTLAEPGNSISVRDETGSVEYLG